MKFITLLTTILTAAVAAPVVVRDLCNRQSDPLDYVQNYNGGMYTHRYKGAWGAWQVSS